MIGRPVNFGRWAVVIRLARRELWRHRRRTALLAALVALPVSGLTAEVVAVRSTTWSRPDALTALLGRADDVVDLQDLASADEADQARFRDRVAEAYPSDSRIVVHGSAPDGLHGADGHLHAVEVTDQPLDDPLLAGMVDLVDGRAPRHDDEIAATPAVLALAHAHRGDEVRLVSTTATVTGVVVDPADPDRLLVVGVTPPPHRGAALHAYVDAPAGFTSADQATVDRLGAWSAAPIGDAFDHLAGDFRYRLLRMGASGGVVLAIAAIVSSAGFAMGAQRQLRAVGLLAASGVPPGSLHGIVLLQGLLTGLAGAIAGAGLGVAAVSLRHDLVESLAGRPTLDVDVRPLDLLVVVAWGAAVPTVAAWLPARFAARASVLAALADRRPQRQLPRSVPLGGVALVAGGLLAVAVWARHQHTGWGYGLAAAMTVMLGGIALTPWVVDQAGRLAGRFRGATRLAGRDFARQLLRSSAAVAAVAAPAGLSVLAATLERTDDVRQAHEHHDDAVRDDEVVLRVGDGTDAAASVPGYGDRLAAILPGAVVVDIDRTVSAGGGPDPTLEVGRGPDGREIRDVLVLDPTDAARLGAPRRTVDALEQGRMVVFGPLPDGASPRLRQAGKAPEAPARVTVDLETHLPRSRGIVVVAPATVADGGLARSPHAVMARSTAALDEAQREAVDAMVVTRCDSPLAPTCDDEDLRASLLGSPTDPVWLEIGRDHRTSGSAFPLDAVGLSLVFTATVTACVLALTTSSDGPERALLAAVGSSPAALRTVAAAQALLLTASAMVLAIPVGLALAQAIVSRPHDTSVGLQPSWPVIGLLAGLLPAACVGVAWLAAAFAGRRRPDPSSLSFEPT